MRHTIGIVGKGAGWHARALSDAAARIGVDVEHLTFEAAWGGYPRLDSSDDELFRCGTSDVRRLDAMIVRSMPPAGLEPIVFRMDWLARLEASGTTIVNPPKSLEFAIDKYRSLGMLYDAGLPIPRTLVVQRAEDAETAFEQLGGDIVLKPIFGGEGRGITRISDLELARRAFRLLERLGAVIYLQEFIPHEGYDVRLLLIGEDFFAMRRVATDWRTNVSRGARTEPFSPLASWIELARTASQAIGAPVVGIDLLPARDGACYILEANGVPGWRGLQRVVEHNLADRIVRFTLDRMRARRES